ncbi:radical SAM/SPASM domain-containing protein [Streptomyces sp. NPDC050617]|uniref:radical SAM/SPASM domain-containing protein n=1 Tax=Streptomyces sp. NPDC050617 TaxID=3154628 RepID=UPI003425C2CB
MKSVHTLELEITGACQLECTHCLTESSPRAGHGSMTAADWRTLIEDAAALGVRRVQLIGGEPTAYPHWRELGGLALSRGLGVEVYSNLFRVDARGWEFFRRAGVSLATSYYSDRAEEHERITSTRGSHARTRANIRTAVEQGVRIRVSVIEVLPGQRVRQAHEDLRSLGVRRIGADRVRAVGRGVPPGGVPDPDTLCGACAQQRAAVLANGDLAGCVMSRFLPCGNVREKPLTALLDGPEWQQLVAGFALPRHAYDPGSPDKPSDPCSPTCSMNDFDPG